MANSADIEQPNDEASLNSVEGTLDGRIDLCVGLAKTAIEHIQRWPHVSALAGLDRAIDTLRFFLADAHRLKDGGRPAAHIRLTAILNDVTAARDKWAQTMGVLVAADISDSKKLAEQQSAIAKQQRETNDERLKQAQSHAAERRKLL